MSWCVESGIVDASPIGGMKPRAKEQPRERVLSEDELSALLTACDSEGYPFGDWNLAVLALESFFWCIFSGGDRSSVNVRLIYSMYGALAAERWWSSPGTF